MAFLTLAQQATLDYAYGATPFVLAQPVDTLTSYTLDYAWGATPFVAVPSAASTSNVLETQDHIEVLRDAAPVVGLNLRETQHSKEVLSSSSQTNYITQIWNEIVRASVLEAVKGTSWMVFDDVHTFDVWLPHGTLSSAANDLAVLNGANLCLLGSELLQFRDVTSLGAGVYRLSHLLRGRFGTEWAMDMHSDSDVFIAISQSTTYRLYGEIDELNKVALLKAVSSGQNVESASPEVLLNTGIGLKPYAPVHVDGTRDGSDNLTITWVRRTRVTGGWNDYGNVPLGELTEAYEIDILNPSTGAVVRTLNATAETVVYSAANQTTDFGGVQATVVCIIYQMSQTVGRGYGTRAVV